ncbi:MAG: LlaJI family restriction endonuclease [Fusobacteriaceae bacterium]
MTSNLKILYFKENKVFEPLQYFKNFNENEEFQYLIDSNVLKITNIGYSFNFVGMISLSDCIIIVFPKYKKNYKITSDEYIHELFRIFQKYSSQKIYESFLFENDYSDREDYFNLFALYKNLINDYIEHGLYENEINIYSLCGNGEIDWEKTIGELHNHFNLEKNPIYLDYFTHDIEEDGENYIRELQKQLLTKAEIYFEEFKKFGVSIPQFDFHFNSDLIGDLEYQIYKINSELRETFSERKVDLLKLMKSILNEINHSNCEGVTLYGTKSYHSIWENICQNVFNNDESFRGMIPKPKWIPTNGEPKTISTLIPDIVLKKSDVIYILDAKYYTTSFDENGNIINSAPGVGDISKQFLYEKSYEIKFENENITFYNAFLFPLESDNHNQIGKVTFELFPNKAIFLLKLSVQIMYQHYLNDEKIDITKLLEKIEY